MKIEYHSEVATALAKLHYPLCWLLRPRLSAFCISFVRAMLAANVIFSPVFRLFATVVPLQKMVSLGRLKHNSPL